MASTTSISRGVRPKFFFIFDSPEGGIRSRRYFTRSETASRPTQYCPAITLRILLNKSCVAASLSTTPRAPIWRASTICLFSMAAVSRIVRTGADAFASARSASMPDTGMAISRRRMSGLSSSANLATSPPSAASPTTSNPASLSSSFRRPSRNSGWSSAIMIRILLAIKLCRKLYLQPYTLSWRRFYHEFTANGAHTFLDDHGPLLDGVQLRLIVAPREIEAAAVVIDLQPVTAILRSKPHDDVLGRAVLSHVDQGLLEDAGHLPAGSRGQCNHFKLGEKARRDPRLALKPIHQLGQESQQLFCAD